MTAPRVAGLTQSPWSTKQRLLLLVLLALGLLGLIAGYFGTAATLQVSRQVAWVNVAGVALLVSGAGVMIFLTAGRREIGRRRLSLFGNVVTEDAAAPVRPTSGAAADLVAAATMTKYHRADCSFVEGKTVTAATAEAHEQAGRRPCGVCLAGGES